MTAGRPKKTAAELKRDGNFRKDRHADREDEANWVSGEPIKPPRLTKYQSKVWDCVVGSLPPECIGMVDTPALEMLMIWLKECERCRVVLAKTKPSEVDLYGKALRNFERCWKSAEAILSSFGVSPKNRNVIKSAEGKAKAFDPIEFMGGRSLN